MNKVKKMGVCSALLGSILLISIQIQAVVILVHGSFARHERWWQPGGSFFQELESHVAAHQETVVPFLWSGSLGHEAKILAATLLAKLILSYPATEPITLIGHSHGGNVINLASNLIHRAALVVPDARGNVDLSDQQSLISCIGNSIKTMLGNGLYKEKRDSMLFLMLLQAYQEVAIFYEEQTNRGVIRINSGVTTEKEQGVDEYKQPCFLIERVYLLGTPVDAQLYTPNMNVIKSVYNLYSKGDKIQRVFGFYKRQYEALERVVNLRVLFQTAIDKNTYYHPSHNGIHDAVVGMWLLSIPHIFGENKGDDFTLTDGSIKFHINKCPLYEPHGRVKKTD